LTLALAMGMEVGMSVLAIQIKNSTSMSGPQDEAYPAKPQ